jgi:septum formation protein
MAHNVLLLASKSLQRAQALTQAKIPFFIISQTADESQCDYGLPFEELLKSIALYKMDHITMPHGIQGDYAFVLTVDTMLQDGHGMVYGKPENKATASKYIQALRDNPGLVGTAFCLDKKQFKNGAWHTVNRITRFVSATYILDIPDHWIEIYLDQFPEYLNIAGALSIESFGAQFLKSLNGSYGTALGLPMYELREALESLEFF